MIDIALELVEQARTLEALALENALTVPDVIDGIGIGPIEWRNGFHSGLLMARRETARRLRRLAGELADEAEYETWFVELAARRRRAFERRLALVPLAS